MANQPTKPRTAAPKSNQAADGRLRAQQIQEQRRREMATRSTLSRLRNRKSDLK
ncbi:MAG TPA: hypothetical protein VN673_14085 [Clostridia bacterium]|nr:hypothetical protein [Clostridia bacterium]